MEPNKRSTGSNKRKRILKKLALGIVLAIVLVGGVNNVMNRNFIKSPEYSFMKDSVKVNDSNIFFIP